MNSINSGFIILMISMFAPFEARAGAIGKTLTVQYQQNTGEAGVCTGSFRIYIGSENAFLRFIATRCGGFQTVQSQQSGYVFPINSSVAQDRNCVTKKHRVRCSDGYTGPSTTDDFSYSEQRTMSAMISENKISLKMNSAGRSTAGTQWSGDEWIWEIAVTDSSCQLLRFDPGAARTIIASSCAMRSGRSL